MNRIVVFGVAIFFALVCLNTPFLRSSASLSRVTRCDQRFGEAFLAPVLRRAVFAFRVAVFRPVLRVAVLCRVAITGSIRNALKTMANLIGSYAALREPQGCMNVI